MFMFGVVSHQVADILWHNLGIQQGFLQTMADVSVECLISTCASYQLHSATSIMSQMITN